MISIELSNSSDSSVTSRFSLTWLWKWGFKSSTFSLNNSSLTTSQLKIIMTLVLWFSLISFKTSGFPLFWYFDFWDNFSGCLLAISQSGHLLDLSDFPSSLFIYFHSRPDKYICCWCQKWSINFKNWMVKNIRYQRIGPYDSYCVYNLNGCFESYCRFKWSHSSLKRVSR